MTRTRFEELQRLGFFKGKKEKDVVERTVNDLIQALYIPCTDERKKYGIDFVADPYRLKKFRINDEAINWGDLKVVDVKKLGDVFWVTIDEADQACPTFARYIERFMRLWGWVVTVQTEW